MPIEVKCPGCQSLLRIADENVGRKSRCPTCSQVFTPEAPASVSPFVAPLPESGPGGRGPADSPWQGVDPQANPYAPTFNEPQAPEDAGPLAPRRITVDEVISKSWLIFKKHWLMTCAVVLIIGGINVAGNMVQNLLVQVTNLAINEPVVTMGLQFLIMIVMYALQIWLQLGQTMVMLDVVRGRPINISKVFSGGPYLLNGLIAMILTSLCVGAIAAVLVGIPAGIGFAAMQTPEGAIIGAVIGGLIAFAPIVIVGLAFSQQVPLIVDRKLSAIDALRQSYEITNGNKFTLFLIGVVLMGISAVALFVGLLMLCVGVIPAMIGVGGFSALIFAVAYLSMTGQRVVVPGTAHDPTSAQFTNVIP